MNGRLVYRAFVAMLIIGFTAMAARAQFFALKDGKKKVDVPFKLVRNLIVIRLSINNNGPYNFILDTGVGNMIITEPKLLDSINIRDKRTIKLSGLGGGEDQEAYITSPLNIDIPGINSVGVSAAIFKKDHFGLSNYAGMPIHGLLGYEFFSRLVVKINLTDSTLTAYRPGFFKRHKKFEAIPLSIENNKPYVTTGVRFCDNTERSCKLVVDIGAGHGLLLDNNGAELWPADKSITANLGLGLTGPINGHISRVQQLHLGRYVLPRVLSSFPNGRIDGCISSVRRDGNIGMDVLKRFTMVFDYPDNMLYLKAGSMLNDPFEHDMSGMELYAAGNSLQRVIISRVEPGSASDDVGLSPDDEITSINFKPVANMSMDEIDRMFRSGDGKSLLLEIFHEKRYSHVILTLKRRI